MDLSKPPNPSDPSSHIPGPTPPVAKPVPGTWTDAWINIGIGVFLLFWQPRFLQWASSRLFHGSFNEFLDPSGNVVPYQTVPEFWSDLAITLFAIVLIADGLLLFAKRRVLIQVALLLTVTATAVNLCWFFGSYNKYGFAPVSGLAVIFGVYIAASQWRMLRPQSK
jgi:hypothetical protein